MQLRGYLLKRLGLIRLILGILLLPKRVVPASTINYKLENCLSNFFVDQPDFQTHFIVLTPISFITIRNIFLGSFADMPVAKMLEVIWVHHPLCFCALSLWSGKFIFQPAYWIFHFGNHKLIFKSSYWFSGKSFFFFFKWDTTKYVAQVLSILFDRFNHHSGQNTELSHHSQRFPSIERSRTSLEVQWLKSCLPMQVTWTRSLVLEDSAEHMLQSN